MVVLRHFQSFMVLLTLMDSTTASGRAIIFDEVKGDEETSGQTTLLNRCFCAKKH